MSENKCCGNCKHFKYEDAVGWGRCVGQMTEFGIHCSHTGCLEHKFVKNAINGWTEITPDNVDELYPVIDRVIIAYKLDKGLAGYSSLTELYKPLKDLALTGGYYYYVLPELKIE